MCEGGVVDGRVFNKVTDNVIILKNGSAPKSYKDICPVRLKYFNSVSLKSSFLESSFLHNNFNGG